MMMKMQMVEGRYFGSARSNWGSRLLISLLNNSWIFLALIRALGVASRLDLLSVMTRSWYYLADFFILSFIWSPTYGQENIHFVFYFIFNLWTEDLSIIYFLPYLPGLKHSFHTQGYIRIGLMRVQGGDSEKCLLFNHHYSQISCDFMVDIFRRTLFRV